MTQTTTPDQRIAAYREHDARAGVDTTGLADTELLLRIIDQQSAELTHINGQLSRMTQDQAHERRAIYATASRESAPTREEWMNLFVDHYVDTATRPITGLIYRIENLPTRLGPKAVEVLQHAARDAKHLIKISPQGDPAAVAREWQEQAWRLREYVHRAATALHEAAGVTRDAAGRCVCEGCELLRDTYCDGWQPETPPARSEDSTNEPRSTR